MIGKIEHPPSPHKRFRVRRDAQGGDILASFDTVEEAVSSIRHRRGDWRYVVLDIRDDRLARESSQEIDRRDLPLATRMITPL
jgi:hypothetical protein